MSKTSANSVPVSATAATFAELHRLLAVIEGKLLDVSSDAMRLSQALRGRDPADRDDDRDVPRLGGDLDFTFNRAGRILELVDCIQARTSFATEALTDMDDDAIGEEVEVPDDEVVSARGGRNRLLRR